MASTDSTGLKNKVGIFLFGTLNQCDPNLKNNLYYSDFFVGSLTEMPDYYTPEKADAFKKEVLKKADIKL